ncbi:PilZ domain-containing protein [Psychromarinibacter sp. C21-152]|uniref:PilZ domain-containing protein n=1 Tax=Psychromarinibacter sediminicola TaxID=3033385 RepID=A0AAE3NNT4_9RHOB|nr:PilZ domain-containing protein [Psychromarinibacter sediminicola]MDF0599247.1 PilZ domain-containing protein [Psychromarinibacter sediminicola]
MAGLADKLDDGRVGLTLPCRVIAGDRTVPATLADLSYGGACIAAPHLPEDGPRAIQAIEVDALGTFDVIFRWRRGDRIGVSFRLDHDAKPRLERYFATCETGAPA